MYENVRLFFSILWLAATGSLVASMCAFIFTWGGFVDYLSASALVWVFASIGAIVTSL